MTHRVDAVVVGAGASGLHAASGLCARGFSVRVLEARERVGGRLLSLPFADTRLDMGATWFWQGERRVAALIGSADGQDPRSGRVVAVTKGRLDFGPWEQIFYGEFDGRRAKGVLVKIIGE